MAGTTLADIRLKIRRITGRPSVSQITDDQINDYINTFYLYDFPEHLRLEPLKVNYQFVTSANLPVYDFPVEYFLTNVPPIFIDGYQCYMSQNRSEFSIFNTNIMYQENDVATGDGGPGPYTFTLSNTPIAQGYKPNPPGAYSTSVVGSTDIPARQLNWRVMISGSSDTAVGGVLPSVVLIDDGLGNFYDPSDTSTVAASTRGSINYLTGEVSLTFASSIENGASINAHYLPYVASRPQRALFYQDQFHFWPIPDKAYTVSIDAYKYPTELLAADQSPQLKEWWQCLAYGAADKIFTDNADFENASKFRPLLDEQMRLVLRRSVVQQASDRTATIYTQQMGYGYYPCNNYFGF